MDLSNFLSRVVDTGFASTYRWVAMKGIDGRMNGYVHLPEGHPWIDGRRIRSAVPGGITYVSSDGWIGFDCKTMNIERECRLLCMEAYESMMSIL